MISVEEAWLKILSNSSVLPAVDVGLRDCTGLVVAEDTRVGCDSPPFDKSMMDGFAVSSEAAFASTESRLPPDDGGRIQLTVCETITAGTAPARVVNDVTASRIMTGAPMPVGANCVIPIERVTFDEHQADEVLVSKADLIPERHVLRKGSIAVVGDPLLSAGTSIQAQHVAALAEFGMAEVRCVPRPGAAVLATGDELLDVGEALTPGCIRNSNEPMLLSQVTRAGCIGTGLGIAADDTKSLSTKIREGLSHNVLLLSGGVSAGTLDLVPQVLQDLGVVKIFHKVAMKPGKPLWFGRFDEDGHTCLVFGLPGNPVSSMVCFEVFVRPALRMIAGYNTSEVALTATLEVDAVVKGDRLTYFPALLRQTPVGLTATALQWAGSADLRTTASANGLIILRPDDAPYSAGAKVECLRW